MTIPYTTIPTFVDGAILTASTLNLLSANQEFIYAQSHQANNPFVSYRKFTELINVDDVYWTIRHRLRYFHYSVNCQTYTGVNHILIDYGPHRLVTATSPSSAVIGYFDLNTVALVVGTRYPIVVEIYHPGSSIEMTIDYLMESDSTSI